MKYVDFAIQTLILVLGLLGVIVSLVNAASPVLTILVAQLFMGVWQLGSCVVSVAAGSVAQRWKLRLLAACLIYLGSLCLVKLSGVGMLLYLTVPAWMLAGFYYYITWKILPSRRHSGHFLPHLGF